MAAPSQPDSSSKYTLLGLDSQPKDHLKRGHAWPDGELVPKAPEEAKLVQALVMRLEEAMGNQRLMEIEELSGVNKTSISRLLRGESWGTLPVIARLERILEADLWGSEHRP